MAAVAGRNARQRGGANGRNRAAMTGDSFCQPADARKALRIAAGIYPKNRRKDDLSAFYATGYRMTVSPAGYPVSICICPDLTFGVLGSRFLRDGVYIETLRGMLDKMPAPCGATGSS